MFKKISILGIITKVVLVASVVLAFCGFLVGPAAASGDPWYTSATGTCAIPTLTNQIFGSSPVLIVGGGLMPGSTFMVTVSSYGQTSRGLTWSLSQTGQTDQNGNFCVLAFLSDPSDQGKFTAQISGVDSTMRQYNPAVRLFTIVAAAAPIAEEQVNAVSVSAVKVVPQINSGISPLPVLPIGPTTTGDY